MGKHILVYTNCKDQKQVDTIVSSLLEKKLIACANSYPVSSTYTWKGEKVSENEITVRMKTTSDHYKEIEKEILRLHSDEIPEILVVDIADGLKEYLDWVETETTPNQKA